MSAATGSVSHPRRKTFVIGDVHGHYDRLEALLIKANCDAIDCTIVQLGDLGHHGGSQGSPTADYLCWEQALNGWIDFVLWGNHDRAVVDGYHRFGGFEQPSYGVNRIMEKMQEQGRLLFAYEAHGWLLTHAGLHAQFKYNGAPIDKNDPRAVATWLNSTMAEVDNYYLDPEGEDVVRKPDRTGYAIVNAIGGTRGGWSPYGGILWRDITEKLYPNFPQVFGHSASRKHKIRGEAGKWWCIDIGGKGGTRYPDANCLAGIWLPSQEVVRVDLGDTGVDAEVMHMISPVKPDEIL